MIATMAGNTTTITGVVRGDERGGKIHHQKRNFSGLMRVKQFPVVC
jgi:hypothetical protein